MQIECPSCSTDNKIEFGENIKCSKCNETFAGHSYQKVNKPVLSTVMAVGIGIIGTVQVDRHFGEHRYPLKVEYELVDSCVNGSHSILNSKQQVLKTQACVCALEHTIEDISYDEFNENESDFLTRFRNSIANCK